MDQQTISNMTYLLKALAHPTRLRILCLLREREYAVNELQAALATTGGNVSQHLAILRNQGIITCRKEANFIYNRIEDLRVMQLMDTLQHLFCSQHT